MFSVQLKQKWLIQAVGWRCAKKGQEKLQPAPNDTFVNPYISKPLARTNHRRFVETRDKKTLTSKPKFYIELSLIRKLGESNLILSSSIYVPFDTGLL